MKFHKQIDFKYNSMQTNYTQIMLSDVEMLLSTKYYKETKKKQCRIKAIFEIILKRAKRFSQFV